tara:strand:+ start:2012 stop:2641 length:630 start_codon:yes stop_codon:yes gene_type:complete
LKRTLKEHRLHLHLSQQGLAELSGVSIRTIQRIENGTSTGSPYVIRSLCKSLNIDPAYLVTNPDPHTEETITYISETTPGADLAKSPYDRRVKYINFSALSILCFPFLNLIVPAVLYFVFKKSLSSPHNKEAALKIISFQILWSVLALILMILIPVVDHYFFRTWEILEIPLFIWGYLFLVIILVLVILYTASNINKAKDLLVFIPNLL